MAAVSPDTLVGFDIPTAKRVVKATRAVESQTIAVDSKRNYPATLIEVFVPRSVVDGIYTGDIYHYNTGTNELTLALEDQTAELLPETL